ncbi:hypothetical protein [Rhizobacter sp. Root404]|uniref:hypothetical protein n=1 Tax=Rhizobacter sp. Root404 TaxID=1736528 RepID=UPI0006F819C6|nr:hypothetical protein [Rhizobacter sp. Root404]KQW38848.1 hypothetical protein ASC76_12845 [Rhizobacter sp. Root404]
MATKPKTVPWTAAPATPEQARERYAFIDKVVRSLPNGVYGIDEVESALGMYLLAHHLGWKVLYFVHSKKTIRKYEEILGIKLSEYFPDFGPDAPRTNAYKIIQAVTNFWKLVSGDEKPPLDIDKRQI